MSNPTWTADGAQNANRQTSALVDYREWPAQEDDPRDSNTSWGTGARVPDPRSTESYGGADGASRPRYSDREYPNHGYWEDQPQPEQQPQSERRFPTPLARTDSWPGAGQSTGSWRLDPAPARPSAPAVTPAGFGFDGDDRDYPAVIWWIAIWYAIPVVLYTLWAVLMSSSGMRGHALHGLLSDALPGIFAIALSVGFGLWLRRISLSWRAITLGFGAACVGAGLATLVISLF